MDDYVRVRDARAAGLPVRRAHAEESPPPFWGIRSRSRRQPQTAPEYARAFTPRMPKRAFYVTLTAAAIHGLPLPGWVEPLPLHVGVRTGATRVEALGVVAHQSAWDRADLVDVDGVQVTSIARTWVDLAGAGLSLSDLVAAGDRALWRCDALVTPAQLDRAIASATVRRGRALIRTARPLLSDRADSPAESALRVEIHRAGLPEPEVNRPQRIGSRSLSPDLSWPAERVLVEYDGDHHRTTRSQWRTDVTRYRDMERAGWIVIRATGDDLRDPRALLAALAGHLGRTTRGGRARGRSL